jgi:hypothetical protein
MTDKKIDLSSLNNLNLGPNWETIPKKKLTMHSMKLKVKERT